MSLFNPLSIFYKFLANKGVDAKLIIMLSSKECLAKYGKPGGNNQSDYMTLWVVPADILAAFSHVKFSALGTIGFPKKIFANNLMQVALEKGLREAMTKGLTKTLHSWDGCTQIRQKRLNTSYSLHSWGAAFDINASENLQGKPVTLSPELAQCFKNAGLAWGGEFSGKSKDGMHFQLQTI